MHDRSTALQLVASAAFRAVPAVRERMRAAAREISRVLAFQDVVLLVYFAITLVVLRVVSRGVGEDAAACARRVLVAFTITALGAYVARGDFGLPTWARAAAYRACLVYALVDSYLMLRDLLPLVRTDAVDATLHAMDLRLFGVEPALWLERFNEPAIVEWFSFFYFSYFWIAAAFMIAVVWIAPARRATTELAVGVLLVFCVGQLGYMAVPGFGPVKLLADAFHGPLQGGFFWSCVERTVAAGGANKDVFPSLHTAAPTFFTLYAWRRARGEPGWRIPAALTGFFAVNIIVSTMLLRWHFAVDVLAGLVLAGGVSLLAPRLAAAEERRRRRLDVPQPWDFGAAGAAAPQVSTSGSSSTSDTSTSSPGTAPASRAPSRVR